MSKIAVTGANGQLATCLADQIKLRNIDHLDFEFIDRKKLDLAKIDTISTFFDQNQFDYIINCAAYTAVDLAETEVELAKKINADAVKAIAESAQKQDAVLIQISTDYVFDGNFDQPYPIDHPTNPINVYGQTKREGEINALTYNSKTFVIRTSWVYSQHGKNFYNTMLRLMSERDEISVVNDQIGKPTNANDLANYILDLILDQNQTYGIKHFSGPEIMSWFEFAQKIAKENQFSIKINPIPTSQFPTPAKRPLWSVLDA